MSGSKHRSFYRFPRESVLFACFLGLIVLLFLGAPSQGRALTAAQDAGQTAPPSTPATPQAGQTDSQVAPAPAAPAGPKPVVLPEGDGKPIATEFCQDCHRLTNLTRAHKDLDDWKDTIHTMMDRGARIPDDKIDTLAQYLFTNFGPKPPNADANAGTASASAAPASTGSLVSPDVGSSVPSASASAAKPVTVELPDGDGKAIATENCQACHKLTNLTKAHKSLDDWKDTVQTMIDRGANVPPDKVDTLVQYLAKNFGPKADSSPATPPAN